MKKLTALILTLILIFSLSAIQGSAGLLDKIESVELSEDSFVTVKELEWYIEMSGLEDITPEDEADYFYCFYPEFRVTLSTGEEIVTAANGYGESKDGKRIVEATAWVDIRDYYEAVENGDDVLPYIYDVCLYSSIGVEMDYVEGAGEIGLIECYIQGITPVSGVPSAFYPESEVRNVLDGTKADVFALKNAVFQVKRNDGTVVKAAVEKVVEEYEDTVYVYYTLDGADFDYWIDEEESVIEIYAGDYTLTKKIKLLESPISSIVIDEVEVSDDFKVESVTYTSVTTDGIRRKNTFEVSDAEPVEYFEYSGGNYYCIYIAEKIEGQPVVFEIDTYESDVYPSRQYLCVTVISDCQYGSDYIEIEGPEQEDTFLNRIIYRFRMFIQRILELFWYI